MRAALPQGSLTEESQWDPSSHQHSSKTNEHLSGIEWVFCSFSALGMPCLHMFRPVKQDLITKSHISL